MYTREHRLYITGTKWQTTKKKQKTTLSLSLSLSLTHSVIPINLQNQSKALNLLYVHPNPSNRLLRNNHFNLFSYCSSFPNSLVSPSKKSQKCTVELLAKPSSIFSLQSTMPA